MSAIRPPIDKLEDVPQGIIDELNENYDNITFELGSSITEITRTYKSGYQEIGNELSMMEVMDAEFNVTEVEGYPTKNFMVRLDVDGKNAIVRAVLDSGSTVTKK